MKIFYPFLLFHAARLCCLLQPAHVYSIKEIHHIDDNDLGDIYIKVKYISFFLLLVQLWSILCVTFLCGCSHHIFQKKISKTACVQCSDNSLWCHGCCKVCFLQLLIEPGLKKCGQKRPLCFASGPAVLSAIYNSVPAQLKQAGINPFLQKS